MPTYQSREDCLLDCADLALEGLTVNSSLIGYPAQGFDIPYI